MNNPQWLVPTENLRLPEEKVHIWRVWLDTPSESFQNLVRTLSPDEKQRAERFRFDRDRYRYVAGRRALRAILGFYLEIDPAELRFRYSPNGKPSLERLSEKPSLEFNLAHSQNLMLCAVAQKTVVGIDVEHLRPVSDLENLTQRFFSPQEYLAIQALPESEQLRAFFQYWTCKEALLKAIGYGLANLKDVEILLTEAGAEIVRLEVAAPTLVDWSLDLFTPAIGYTAALATKGCNFPLCFWQWQSE